MKPPSPLQPLIRANVKPPSPMLAPKQRPLKPPSPLQPKNAPKTPISHPQRRHRFQLGLGLREQRRRRFHARDFRCRLEVAGPGRASSRRAERSSRRGRLAGGPPPTGTPSSPAHRTERTAPRTPAEPQATSSIANSGCAAGEESAGGTGGRKRAWLRCPWAVAGPGRTTSRRAERSSRRGRLAGGPPPTGTPSSPAPQQDQTAPGTPAAPQAPPNGEASELLVVLRVLVGLAAVGATEGADRSHLLRRQ